MQAQGVAFATREEVGQGFALHLQRGQRLAQQAADAYAQPAGERGIAAGDAAFGIGPGHRGAKDIKGRGRCCSGHCTNVVQNGAFGAVCLCRKGADERHGAKGVVRGSDPLYTRDVRRSD